ncbi:hypothetical protein [Actinoplanes sp. G11-F43]|uniref:hypothetical protein n=1 Tax=Actinoplanes sp. G11-F43 TaxID=3424130 RepID=UPI003D325D51
MTIWSANKLFVDVVHEPDGTLRIQGQDLDPGNMFEGEYEYAMTVRPADVPRIVAALGGDPGADVLDLMTANAQAIITLGESRFLKSIGVEYEFWSHVSDS